MDNISYEIKPIFTPNTNICHDFARIHISCLSLTDQKKSLTYNNLGNAYLNTWNTKKNVFTFAAYSNKEMVGFITGSLAGKNMFTRSLYVMPQYRGYGIGTALLNSAENAASLVAPNMELFSLSGAVSFYQNHGYKNAIILERIIKVKKLSNAPGIIPVFQWCDKLQSKLNVKIDVNLLKKSEHQPIFVYVNGRQKIDGIAIRMPNRKEKIMVTPPEKNLSQFYTQQLSAALNRSL